MPASVTSITPRRTPPSAARTPEPPRRRVWDNPKLILAGIAVLVAVLAALLMLARGTSRYSPDVLSEFVLYALSAADLTMLAALLFVLVRNIVKLVVERRRALPFARFRPKLVLLLLGMTFVPAVLVLLVGSELMVQSLDRWFNAPMDELLSSANTIASDYYSERQHAVAEEAERLAQALSAVEVTAGNDAVGDLVAPDIAQRRLDAVRVFAVRDSTLENVVTLGGSSSAYGVA